MTVASTRFMAEKRSHPQGQIAQQDDIQLLLKLILAIYVGGDYSCIRMHHFIALAPKAPSQPPGRINPEFVHVQCGRIPF